MMRTSFSNISLISFLLHVVCLVPASGGGLRRRNVYDVDEKMQGNEIAQTMDRVLGTGQGYGYEKYFPGSSDSKSSTASKSSKNSSSSKKSKSSKKGSSSSSKKSKNSKKGRTHGPNDKYYPMPDLEYLEDMSMSMNYRFVF